MLVKRDILKRLKDYVLRNICWVKLYLIQRNICVVGLGTFYFISEILPTKAVDALSQ